MRWAWGTGAILVRDQDGAGLRTDRRFDLLHVDLVGIRRHVDEHRHEPGPQHRRDVGRERDGRRDDLVARREPEQLDREIQRRGAGVHHDAALLAEARGDGALHRLHVLPDAQRRGAAAQHLDDCLDMPYDEFPWFKDQLVKAILNVEEQSEGHFYWPDIDVDLSIESIEHPDRFPLKAKTDNKPSSSAG